MTQTPNPSPNRSAFPIWAWIAAAALALLTGYLVRQMGVQTSQLADLKRQIKRAEVQNQALQAQLELSQQISAVMLSPDSKLLKLDPKDSDAPPMVAYLHPHMGVVVAADKVPAVPASRTLQLWVAPRQGTLLSVAIFHPNSDGLVSVLAPVSIPRELISALSITNEPAGGSPQPTSPPLWSAQLK